MTAEVVALTNELRAVREQLHMVLRRLEAVDAEARAERKRAKRHRIGSFVLAAAVAGLLLLGYRDSQEKERADHRACVASNQTRADIRASIVETVLVIAERTDDPERLTPLIGQIQDRLIETIPDRDCS